MKAKPHEEEEGEEGEEEEEEEEEEEKQQEEEEPAGVDYRLSPEFQKVSRSLGKLQVAALHYCVV